MRSVSSLSAGPYHVSPRFQFDNRMGTFVTPDEGLFQAAKLSGGNNWGVILMLWHRDLETGEPHVRAIGHAGRSYWVKPCTACTNQNRDWCTVCTGLGLVEQ